jgi:hypothetical protein
MKGIEICKRPWIDESVSQSAVLHTNRTLLFLFLRGELTFDMTPATEMYSTLLKEPWVNR